MGRQKDSSCNSYKKINEALMSGPKCPTEIHNLTRLNPNTVASRLRYLANKGMVTSRREGQRVIYEIKKTESPYFGWEIPWIALMMNREDWKKNLKQIHKKITLYKRQRKWNSLLEERYGQILEFLKEPINKELLEGYEKAGIDLKSKTWGELLPILNQNYETPVCLECLQNYKVPKYSKLDPETGEYICHDCGMVVGRKQDFAVSNPESKTPQRYPLLEKMGKRISKRNPRVVGKRCR